MIEVTDKLVKEKMRFKARLLKEKLLMFSSVLHMLERVGTTTVIFLNADNVRLAVVTESPDSPKVFSEFKQECLFFDYRIESQSNNSILFEIEISLLLQALSSGKHAPQCLLKLVKRGSKPCLCFESRAQETMMVAVLHDIPITIMQPNDIVYYLPPDMTPPTISLELPRGKLIRTVIDRMMKISRHLHIDAEQTGRIVFRVENSTVSVKTYYTGLQPRFEVLDPQGDANNTASVKVDIRRVSTLFNLERLVWDTAVLYISENEALVLHVTLSPQDSGTLTIYAPVLIDESI